MAKRVPLKTLKQPRLVAMHYIEHPFTKSEIGKLVAKLKVYALTKDCEAHYLWTNGAQAAEKRKKNIGSRM